MSPELHFPNPTAYEDYQPLNTTISLPEGSTNESLACAKVPIIDDSCFEKCEDFNLHIYSVEDNVHIYGHLSAGVYIYDDDGMSG